MVDPLDVPLARVLGTDVGSVFAGLHAEQGVDLHMGVSVSAEVDAARLADDGVPLDDLVAAAPPR